MSSWRALRHLNRLLLPAILMVSLLHSVASIEPTAAADAGPRNYIVTLAVADAALTIGTSGRNARQRIRRRAARTAALTERLSREHDLRVQHRFTSAVSGFSARLTPAQAARLKRDRAVASIRPTQRFRIAGQVVPLNLRRIKAAPGGGGRADVDADIAVLDTGIGPVGGNELNVRGGVNCSADGLPDDAWQDRYSSRHGTHVAGTAAARDNGVGSVGVAPGARLWSVRVFRAGGYGDTATIMCGLDWAVSTHGPGAPAGTQPIDVINMSIQGPRPVGAPEACGVDAVTDPLHASVCAAHAAGITIVVAAGNSASDAGQVTPAGYDQVITVAALSDFDGDSGSKSKAACVFFGAEVDDSYASYSNHGDDIDIVAPGTCVRSTYPSSSGDDTQLLTGTSMASPHVAGAVARYLAAHPATTPNQMRRLVRASGRLDWLLKSDPHWSGPNDADAPNRVLDVAALTGSPQLRTWLSASSVRLGGNDQARTLRVDLQRSGGYNGTVHLDVNGLSSAVGRTSFDRPGATLSGLSGLGARLTVTLEDGGSDGSRTLDVRATGSGGSPASTRSLSLTVDRSGPDVRGFSPRIRGNQAALTGSGAAVYFPWRVSDALSKVKRSTLQRKVGSGPWRDLGTRNKQRRVVSAIKPWTSYQYRVRSVDDLGNRSLHGLTTLRMVVRDSSSDAWIAPTASWIKRSSRAAVGGSLLAGRKDDGPLITTFEGSAVAILAPVGPGRGAIRVRVDDGSWQHVSLKAPKPRDQRIVFSRKFPAGGHRIEVQVQRGRAAIDALLILR